MDLRQVRSQKGFEMSTKKVKIVETILRDAHQSLLATRMKTSDMMEAFELLDEVGYYALEAWGGATFDSALRYLDEDPWDRLDQMKKKIKKTPLMMLLRGQNILGYKHYPDDILVEFIKRANDHGVEIFRVFDALNDPRNIEKSLKIIREIGAHAQLAMSYTTGSIFDTDYYVKLAKTYEQMGAHSICIKDMSGLLLPEQSKKLVTELKKNIQIPIDLHSHMTSGLGAMSLLEGIHAGVDIVDTALSPLSGGTSHSPTESIAMALSDTEYDPELNMDALLELGAIFTKLRARYFEEGLIDQRVLGVDIKALKYQVPGGMLSNLMKQLNSLNQADRFNELMEEIPKVRKDMGYPPLVTPMSQMVGAQALLNIMMGTRYKAMPKEVKAYLRGEYGQAPAKIADFLMEKVKKEEMITTRPADLLEDGLEEAREAVKEYSDRVEDALSYALFPEVSMAYLQKQHDR